LREKIRRALVEEVPDASDEKVEKALARIMSAVDPFERAAAEVLFRYDKTFADLAK
jgi:molecular chaperone GrpE (heat shock protein)